MSEQQEPVEPPVAPVDAHAVVPITEALPELRAEVYADVCAWDAARLELRAGFYAADGAYLAKIQDKLAPAQLWHNYLKARHISPSTAYARIAKAQGRPYQQPAVSKPGDARLLEEQAASLRAAEAEAARQRATQLEQQYQHVNHELAASHAAIKRLKASGKTDSIFSILGVEITAEEWAERLEKRRAKAEAHTRHWEKQRAREDCRRTLDLLRSMAKRAPQAH